MVKQFTLEYWTDDGNYFGRLKEVPEVLGQGKTLEELKKNIRKAYKLLVKCDSLPESKASEIEMEVEVKSEMDAVEILKNHEEIIRQEIWR